MGIRLNIVDGIGRRDRQTDRQTELVKQHRALHALHTDTQE